MVTQAQIALNPSQAAKGAEPRTALVELDGINKTYRTAEIETLALNNLHLTIEEGEFVAIEGPSGSGKTTLLSVLGLLEESSGGSYQLCNRRVDELTARARARMRNQYIGFIFQDFNLIGDLSVAENVELPLLYRKLTSSERRERVEAALKKVDMTHRRSHLPSQLSGGQQQRVAVARAVVTEPRLLLADEPTGNLDSKNGEAIMGLIQSLHQAGTTVCMVSHNPVFSRLAERVLYLSDGQIARESSGASSKLRS